MTKDIFETMHVDEIQEAIKKAYWKQFVCQCDQCRSKSDTGARQPYDIDLTAREITPERTALPAPEGNAP